MLLNHNHSNNVSINIIFFIISTIITAPNMQSFKNSSLEEFSRDRVFLMDCPQFGVLSSSVDLVTLVYLPFDGMQYSPFKFGMSQKSLPNLPSSGLAITSSLCKLQLRPSVTSQASWVESPDLIPPALPQLVIWQD